MDAPRPSPIAEWFRDRFASDGTKLLLSLLILLSVLPFSWANALSWPFLVIFTIELFGRTAVLRDDLRRETVNRVEIIFLVVDLVAVLSFLPLEAIWEDMRLLRLVRLCRMVLLLGYWGPMAREIWAIVTKRERRFQLFFVCAAAAILSFLSSVLLFHFTGRMTDFNGDGDPTNDTFGSMLWWSFRQVEDPGNLVTDATASVAFVCSVVLTTSGLFVFSFLVGIANSVVEELVDVARERRLGMRNHSVICNIDEYARVLLEELVAYYTKDLRTPRVITMGEGANRFHYMYQPALRRIRYRRGRPLNVHDLEKVDADRAKRVILRGKRDHESSDSEIVSQILSVRQINPDCAIFAELFRGDNVRAALEAGGARTFPILTNRFVGRFLAKILMFPGVEAIHTELLSSAGVEIYSCLFDYGALQGVTPRIEALPPFAVLLEQCYRAHGVILLGYLLANDDHPGELKVLMAPTPTSGPESSRAAEIEREGLCGFIGLAPNFAQLKDFVASLPYGATEPTRSREIRMPSLALCPVATQLSRVLICGFHDGLVDFCVQLFFYSEILTIYVMVPEATQVPDVMRAFVDRPRDGFARAAVAQGFTCSAQGSQQISCETAHHHGTIIILVGDWSKEDTMVGRGDSSYRLAEMDAVVFTYTPDESDPDARTALGLLKLIHLREGTAGLVKPSLRIICEVQSVEKAYLLRRRFASRAGKGSASCQAISVVAAETVRDALLAQSVLIPNVAAIYRELLCEGGLEIWKLIVRSEHKTRELSFGSLLTALYRHEGLILLAVELDDEEGLRVVTCPEPGSEEYRFPASALVGLLALGHPGEHIRAGDRCPHCFSTEDR